MGDSRIIRVQRVRTDGPNYWIVRDEMGRQYRVRIDQVSASNTGFYVWTHQIVPA